MAVTTNRTDPTGVSFIVVAESAPQAVRFATRLARYRDVDYGRVLHVEVLESGTDSVFEVVLEDRAARA